MRRTSALYIILAAVALAGCFREPPALPLPSPGPEVISVKAAPGAPMRAAFAKRVITPRYPVWIAGFGPLRMSFGAHDDLMVRAVVVEQGGEKLAMVAVDVVGLMRTEVMDIKAGIAGFRPDQVLIASTHTHAGPDTMGLWGLPPLVSGVNPIFMRSIKQAVIESVAEADGKLVPVSVAVGAGRLRPGIMVNFHFPEPPDYHIGVLNFRDRAGKSVGTILNVSSHPEAMWGENHILSSDYAGRVCVLAEERWGGGAVFFSGAIGAMMSPRRPVPGEKHDFARLERISQEVFGELAAAMEAAVTEESPRLAFRRKTIVLPIQNDRFVLLFQSGIVKRDVYEGQQILSEVAVIEIGPAQFATFPGEAYPKLGLAVRAKQKPHSFQIGLADDELGYILYPDDYGTEEYGYETSVSLGPQTGVIVEEALTGLLALE